MAKEKKIPEVSFSKFLGRALEIVKNPLPFHHDNFEEKGDTFILNIGFQKKIIFSRNAGFLKYALQKNQRNYTKSEVQTKEVAKYLGKGLLTAEGEHWKTQRKLIQPAFHKKHLSNLLEIMQETINEELAQIPFDKEIDIEPYFGRLAFQVVAKSLFSGEVEESTIARLQEIVEASQKILVRELRQPYLAWWFKGSGLLRRHFNMVKEARGLIEQLIEQRKKSSRRKDDLLDLLLDARYEDGGSMEKEQMIDEIMILFTAGHETTSNALTFTCQLLAQNPEYQGKIGNDVALGGELDLMSTLMSQQMTRQVLEEAMRLYPPAYFIDRMNLEDDNYDGMKIKKGTPLLFSAIEIHRHKDYWENPMKFKPERFAGPNNQHSDYYFPFGAGPRMCIGNNFAMFEMQMVISELIANRTIISTTSEIEILPLITLRPKNAYLRFEQRT
ncbi:cytochrome P450 [Croceivirga thetidis]|uniref:Cytochrome P450 n=1 Tax=Croceivirga thetidis TaxID=2721623 RepID=A0ABX1GLW5_9FLAO|nr:cytochrome P450 [Croceivirga thetidis]NKI30633.1 cytochrome P450 [Croceivirga thetidis]